MRSSIAAHRIADPALIKSLRLSANLAAISYYRELAARDAYLRRALGGQSSTVATSPPSCPFDWYAIEQHTTADTTAARSVVVQGTRDRAQWRVNLDIDPVTLVDSIRAHRGAFTAALALANSLADAGVLRTAPGQKIEFIGHSMGGSVAMLAAMILLLENTIALDQVSFVHMFGCPAVLHHGIGRTDWVRDFQHVVKHVVLSNDVVPRLLSAKYDHVLRFNAKLNYTFSYSPQRRPYQHVGEVMVLHPSDEGAHPLLDGPGLYSVHRRDLHAFMDYPPLLQTLATQQASAYKNHSVTTYARNLGAVARANNYVS
jgi:hypothetical protein